MPFVKCLAAVLTLVAVLAGRTPAADVVIAEGERFRPRDGDKGWKVTQQNDSYASHSYGGMWLTHGACLGAPADSVDAVATQTVDVPKAGRYRVWSKYQAPPYFNYLHKVEVVQNGRVVFAHVYGRQGTPRLWSFSGVSDELWWPWGVDHDTAEAPKATADLAAGAAEVRLITVANPKPAGDRFIDFIVLTTHVADEYQGFKPYAVGSPFTNEALAASRLYLRFKNTASAPAQLTVTRPIGHYQPSYGGATIKVPDKPVASGQWSEWLNIGPFCRLVSDDGVTLDVPGAASIPVQFARDVSGKDLVGDLDVKPQSMVLIPLEITWKPGATVKTTAALAGELIARSKTWRTANGGKKPKEILFYGAFTPGPNEDWLYDLKDAMGYNTNLPERYDQVRKAAIPAHFGTTGEMKKLAADMKPPEKARLRAISLGDEIGLGQINFDDPKNQVKFVAWLKARGLTAKDLGVDPAAAKLMQKGDPRLVWYSNLFNEDERFAEFRVLTQTAKQLFGADVLTGANYSPHHLALCYGPIFQWVDLFKHQGMSMFWGEDYIFSVPEAPQVLSWMFGQMRCATKYNGQPIHFYVMPHAPGQEPGFLRRNMVFSVGCGARSIDSFGVAPEDRMTENYVAWGYPETFRVLHESIFDAAEAEQLQAGGKVRPARVALVTGKATDFNESRVLVDKAKDPFTARCQNAPAQVNQIICRKEQQMLYLALRHAQHAVDLVTEDDIVELDTLKNYDVVYFAGEWVDHRAAAKLDAWVQAGGVFYATGGVGHRNEFDQPESALLTLLGLKAAPLTKNLAVLRTLLELPLVEPIDTIAIDGKKVAAVGLRQVLTPATAKVLGTWADGSPAVTVHEHGKGKAFAVGTLAGLSYMKTAVRTQPWARGGRHTLYNPTEFDPAAARLVHLAVDARQPEKAASCDHPCVEAVVIDSPKGTLLTLVNWTNEARKGLKVSVRLAVKPADVRSVERQKSVPSQYQDGVLSFTIDLNEADFVLLPK